MVQQTAREDEAFDKLKEKAFAKITIENAESMLETGKNKVIEKLQQLDLENITEVEDFYIIVAEFMQASTYVCAINKASRKHTLAKNEIMNIGADDTQRILFETFKDHPRVQDLQKIIEIDDKYQPSTEAWAALHARMQGVALNTREYWLLQNLQNTTLAYKKQLEMKLNDNKVPIPLPEVIPNTFEPLIQKMILRYKAVCELETSLAGGGKLKMQNVEKQIHICLDNEPGSIEMYFLKMLQSAFFPTQKKCESLRRDFYEDEFLRHTQKTPKSLWNTETQASILSAMDQAIQQCEDLPISQLLSEIKTEFMNPDNQSFALDKFLLVLATADPEHQAITIASEKDAEIQFKENAMAYAGSNIELSTKIGELLDHKKRTDTEYNVILRSVSQNLFFKIYASSKKPVEYQFTSTQSEEIKTLFQLEKKLHVYQDHLEKYMKGSNYNFIGANKYQVVSQMLGTVNYEKPMQSIQNIWKLLSENKKILSQHATKIDTDNRADLGIFQYVKNFLMQLSMFNKGMKLSEDIEATQKKFKSEVQGVRKDDNDKQDTTSPDLDLH